jgi:hypothetical protein
MTTASKQPMDHSTKSNSHEEAEVLGETATLLE